jgi:hypothetical protein
MPQVGKLSSRTILRLFQRSAESQTDGAFLRDLQMLQARDLDLSVKAGALLAFDALIMTAGFNPISASPGAPVSLDAVKNAGPVWLTMLGVVLLSVAAFFSVRGIMVSEDIASQSETGDPQVVRQHLLAAFCVSLDRQAAAIARAGAWTVAGGAVMIVALFWSVVVKYF